jgi:hypothetical protein
VGVLGRVSFWGKHVLHETSDRLFSKTGKYDIVANSLFVWKLVEGISCVLLVGNGNINSLAFPGPPFEKILEYIRE